MSDYNFWADKLGAGQQAEDVPVELRADSVGYRAARRAVSASRIYDEPLPLTPEQRAQARPSLYVPGYQGLGQYQNKTAPTVFDRRPNESAVAWRRRMTAMGGPELQNLPEEIRAKLAETDETQDAHGDAAGHRRLVDARSASMDGSQQMGRMARDVAPEGEQRVQQLGGMPGDTSIVQPGMISTLEVHRIIREREQANQPVQRTDVSSLRSSATGWIGASA
jgi:hypothetical protein